MNIRKKIKKGAAFTFQISDLVIKASEVGITVMLALQKDPDVIFKLLLASALIKTAAAPFTGDKEDQLMDGLKLLSLIPAGLLTFALLDASKDYYPALWLMASMGADFTLILLGSFMSPTHLSGLEFAELSIDSIKKNAIIALLATGNVPGTILGAIKTGQAISNTQLGLSIFSAGASVASFSLSAGKSIYGFFKKPVAASKANDSFVERAGVLEVA